MTQHSNLCIDLIGIKPTDRDYRRFEENRSDFLPNQSIISYHTKTTEAAYGSLNLYIGMLLAFDLSALSLTTNFCLLIYFPSRCDHEYSIHVKYIRR